jgi:hypothetical protein
LVPVIMPSGERFTDSTTFPGFVIHRYRPRIEGLFARIERWTNVATGEIHWRSITKDNITTLYGKDNGARIFDPDDPDPVHPTRIFSWLICQSYDDKGNAIVYKYAAEDDRDVDHTQANERNRVRTANRYLKHILYGNRTPNRDTQWKAIDVTSRSMNCAASVSAWSIKLRVRLCRGLAIISWPTELPRRSAWSNTRACSFSKMI